MKRLIFHYRKLFWKIETMHDVIFWIQNSKSEDGKQSL